MLLADENLRNVRKSVHGRMRTSAPMIVPPSKNLIQDRGGHRKLQNYHFPLQAFPEIPILSRKLSFSTSRTSSRSRGRGSRLPSKIASENSVGYSSITPSEKKGKNVRMLQQCKYKRHVLFFYLSVEKNVGTRFRAAFSKVPFCSHVPFLVSDLFGVSVFLFSFFFTRLPLSALALK